MARRYTNRQIAEAERRQDERRELTLQRLADWPEGMPPLSGIGSGAGPLFWLTREGLAEVLGLDDLGDYRFRLTDAGRARLEST
jgi:hypothetical protein